MCLPQQTLFLIEQSLLNLLHCIFQTEKTQLLSNLDSVILMLCLAVFKLFFSYINTDKRSS